MKNCEALLDAAPDCEAFAFLGLVERGRWNMLNIGQLESLNLNMLAMYCLRVAESPEASYWEAEQARQFKAEWALFIGQTRPRIPELEKGEDVEPYIKDLKQRMVGFLASCPLQLTLAKEPTNETDREARRVGAGQTK
jgi:hypothetical protein